MNRPLVFRRAARAELASSRRHKLLIRTAIAAAVLSIVPCYYVSAGPAAYFDGRGWIDGDIARTPYLPLLIASRNRIGER
jgi:hypothetical protein